MQLLLAGLALTMVTTKRMTSIFMLIVTMVLLLGAMVAISKFIAS